MNKPVFNNKNGWPTNNIWNGINQLLDILGGSEILNMPQSYFNANMAETDDEYVIYATLSGFDREDVYMELNGEYLTINAKKSTQNRSQYYNMTGYSSTSQIYRRTFYVKDVVSDRITSNYANGVLVLHLPKRNSFPAVTNNKYLKPTGR